ncbi:MULTISPECIES: hypothetical protein [unclassified Mesorhizobium]|uniref:hypothetical protein n=1 Tax=unclassified Mesorhizobium TaxID=325217 RepID=UPI000FCA0592|nr:MULTISPECIES: hypothetical protein [unclassified Mesorhizobium]RUT87502.1 hypothetical protein EOD14_10110 [Mesorhizobium sp. M7A.T.Ca.US.000.02.1.1]RUT94104.1 hypothetical protein EOD15_03420 [Mesorhizobium sp. M7A.T.Ca.US.000.02.2.1]RUU04967.1 hypothetical protein EOD12_05130 [Mesorhizobium sp. M7A.T.Ca.TU.009.02.1.1]RUU77279.1 hypothetical protein EOD03_22330 [Mesorhizobium sp. M7A.T.Ca.TU.009.01.1.2]
MRNSELAQRLCKGWTPWAKGPGDHDIEKIWWAARVLHFPKLNFSTWFDGSEVVGTWHWGFRQKWNAFPSDPIEHLLRDVGLRIPPYVRDMSPQSRVNPKHGGWGILSSFGNQHCNFGGRGSIKDAETEITAFEGVQNRREG